jgi:hypothetical protein
MNNQYIIEWSETQDLFHVHTPEEMFEKNLRAFYNRLKLDWQPIAVAADFDEACKIINILERRRRKFLPEVIKEKLERILHRRFHAEAHIK